MGDNYEDDLEEYLSPSGTQLPPPESDEYVVIDNAATPSTGSKLGPTETASLLIGEPLTSEKNDDPAERPDPALIVPTTLHFLNDVDDHDNSHSTTPRPKSLTALIESVTQSQPSTTVVEPNVGQLGVQPAVQPIDMTFIESEPLTQEVLQHVEQIEEEPIEPTPDVALDIQESDDDIIQPTNMNSEPLGIDNDSFGDLPPPSITVVDSPPPPPPSNENQPNKLSSSPPASSPAIALADSPPPPSNGNTVNLSYHVPPSTVMESLPPASHGNDANDPAGVPPLSSPMVAVTVSPPPPSHENDSNDSYSIPPPPSEEPIGVLGVTAADDAAETQVLPPPPPPSHENDSNDSYSIPPPPSEEPIAVPGVTAADDVAETQVLPSGESRDSGEEDNDPGEEVFVRGRGRLRSHLRRPSSDSEDMSSEDEVEEVIVTRPSTRNYDSDDSVVVKSVKGPRLSQSPARTLRRNHRSMETIDVDEVSSMSRSRQNNCVDRAALELSDDDSSSGNDWLNPPSQKRKRVQLSEDDDDDRPVKRRRKRHRKQRNTRTLKKRLSYESSDDSESPVRPRKRRMRSSAQTAKTRRGYRRDDFVVEDDEVEEMSSSNDGGAASGPPDDDDDDDGHRDDSVSSSSSGENETVSNKVRKAVKKELKGGRPPFGKGLICYICKWMGSPPIGSSTNGYRDGFIQPLGNFSANVKRGNYGTRLTEPFCLQHTSGDQNQYVKRLEATAARNRMLTISDEEEEENEDDETGSVVEVVVDTPVQPEENVELSVEKVQLDVRRNDSSIARMHGAEWDWDMGCYIAPPGTNLVPLKKWIVTD